MGAFYHGGFIAYPNLLLLYIVLVRKCDVGERRPIAFRIFDFCRCLVKHVVLESVLSNFLKATDERELLW